MKSKGLTLLNRIYFTLSTIPIARLQNLIYTSSFPTNTAPTIHLKGFLSMSPSNIPKYALRNSSKFQIHHPPQKRNLGSAPDNNIPHCWAFCKIIIS